jgi:hypothetical protein
MVKNGWQKNIELGVDTYIIGCYYYAMEINNSLQRIHVYVTTAEQWYTVMRECRAWFGKNWRTQPRVKRKLTSPYVGRVGRAAREPIAVWFEVPDPKFATWISVKMSLQVVGDDKLKAAK